MPSQFELEPQTVGEIAFEIISFYAHNGIKTRSLFEPSRPTRRTKSIPKAFFEYWKLHKSRKYYAGWFAVKLVRAGLGSRFPREERLKDIRKVREQIDQVSLDDRVWILLWLQAFPGGPLLATEEELIELCKKVGPKKLIHLLQRNIPTSDPDLLPDKSNNWPYKQMCYFILSHAQDLLREQDIEALIACENHEKNHDAYRISDPTLTSLWSIARAHLMKPSEGVVELRQAYYHFQNEYQLDDRAKISHALWSIGGLEQQGFLTDWFYDEINNRDYAFDPLVRFIDTVLADKEQPGLQLIKRIVADKRFSQINWNQRELERMESKLKLWRGKLLSR